MERVKELRFEVDAELEELSSTVDEFVFVVTEFEQFIEAEYAFVSGDMSGRSVADSASTQSGGYEAAGD